ncbi:MAG: hypothetical protein ETSY1_20635 [Candidatus Entotheonella factor]|uniref:NACHT C-terminal Helical domain-containing protein n=1 Tax=Entotheonella factor TaxID=1429438 RepID=W4LKX8_ENTF1|nr:MAG: hypothetical protein ETSY1_20635 [Candidatus Entotheonella factor]
MLLGFAVSIILFDLFLIYTRDIVTEEYIEVSELISLVEILIADIPGVMFLNIINIWSFHKSTSLYILTLLALSSIQFYTIYPFYAFYLKKIIFAIFIIFILLSLLYLYHLYILSLIVIVIGYLDELAFYVILIMFGIAFSFIIFMILRFIDLLKDFQLIRRNRKVIVKNRQQIASTLAKCRTPYFRLRYVQSLQNSNITPEGDWPAELPNFGNDKASSLLAQLEERWLGLQR